MGTWSGQRNNPVGLPVHLFRRTCATTSWARRSAPTASTSPGPTRCARRSNAPYQAALDGSRPAVVNVQAKKEFWLRDQYAPGFLGKIEPGLMSYYH